MGIRIQMVKQNLISYLEWYEKIRNISECIITLKNNNQYESAYAQEKYLKLLANNMAKDISIWTEYNNNLIQ